MSRILRLDKTRMYIVVAYDITDDKLRRKIVKILEKYWFRVQKSVFETYIKPNQFEEMKRKLNWVLNLAKKKRKNIWPNDSVRFYFLSKTWEDWWNRIDWLWPGYEKIDFEEVLIV